MSGELALWLVPLAVSIGLGLARVPRWTVFGGVILALAAGLLVTALEPLNYDMRGFGLLIGMAVAVVCVVVWLVARGARRLVTRLPD